MNVIVPAGYFDPYEDWEDEKPIAPAPTGATRIARIPISTFNGWEDLEETLLSFSPNDLGQINIPLDRTMVSSIRTDRPLLERSARELERELLSDKYQPWPNATRIVTIDWPNRVVVIKFRVTHFTTTSSYSRTPARMGRAVGPLSRSLLKASQNVGRMGSMDDLNRQLARTKNPRLRPRPRRNPGDNAVSNKEALEIDQSNYKKGKLAVSLGIAGVVLPSLGTIAGVAGFIWFVLDTESFIEAFKWVGKKIVDYVIKPAWGAAKGAVEDAFEDLKDEFGGMGMLAVAGGLILVGVVMMQRK